MTSYSRAPEASESRRSTPASTSASVGTVRNRTAAFLKYRRNARGAPRLFDPGAPRPGVEQERLVAPSSHALEDAEAGARTSFNGGSFGADHEAADPLATPGYVDFVSAAHASMASIRQRMAELASAHAESALTRFDDGGGEDAAVEVATQHITRLFRACEAQLRAFGAAPGEEARAGSAHERVRRNVQKTLAVELQRLSVQFRKQQKAYLAQLKARDARGGGGLGGAGGAEGLLGSPGGRRGEEGDPGFSDVQAMRVSTVSALAQERDREVARIVASIGDLAQVMKDLSVLVIDQGTVLDRIDYNMETAAASVEEGVRNLQQAEKTQRRGVAAMCVMLLVVAVVVLFLMLMLKIALF